eukprot:755934-Hanusia_phi.AAC.2
MGEPRALKHRGGGGGGSSHILGNVEANEGWSMDGGPVIGRVGSLGSDSGGGGVKNEVQCRPLRDPLRVRGSRGH